MTDLYLKFASEAEAQSTLYDNPTTTSEGEEYRRPRYANIDTIGIIEGIDGWHANVRLLPAEDGSALQPYSVNPSSPLRVWG